MKLFLRLLLVLALAITPSIALARNIVISNDDGLTSNVRALYLALKEQGHDVIVSVPCTGQSGMGSAIEFSRPLVPLTVDCLNGAARAGDPGAGPMTRPGFADDFFYVDGTPIMALMYGLDVAAQMRWGAPPDLVISGPNEGQNVGDIVLSSGTVSNARFAATRGIPAVAFSAGADTRSDAELANPMSAEVARLAAELMAHIDAAAGSGVLLPAGMVLNVNFPDNLVGARWRASRHGTYNAYIFRFTDNVAASASPETIESARRRGITLLEAPGLTGSRNTAAPRPEQMDDESVVVLSDIAVTAMMTADDSEITGMQIWLRSFMSGMSQP